MAAMPDEPRLAQWIEQSIADHSHILAAGYQGKTLLYDDGDNRLVIKVPHGRGLARWLHTRMLRHEREAYRRLEGLDGVPGCRGMVASRYLVLDYIEGHTIREQRPRDENRYFDAMYNLIQSMHARGVAHMDLKRKDNLYVTTDDGPCLLDFGAAVIYRPGFHPFNHFRYRLGLQFDINAWVKHKHHHIPYAQDYIERHSEHYRTTAIEKWARRVKRWFNRR